MGRRRGSAPRLWRVGLYIRLSREDGRTESLSVQNQRKILMDYLKEEFQGPWELEEIFVDDGLTGTDDSRESFQRMIAAVKEGAINCVVCKTLSRAFRNYADQGYFLEEFFPRYRTRFISVGNPRVDSFLDPEAVQMGLEIPINGILNDRYAAKQTYHFTVADPVRGRHDHFIARVNQRSQRDIDHVLCTAGDDRLRRLILQTVIRLHAVANRLTQLDHTGCGRISRFSVADRAHTRIADAVGCGKIGLTGAKADNVLPFCFHLLRQCADSQRRGRAHSGGNFGQWLHRHTSFS